MEVLEEWELGRLARCRICTSQREIHYDEFPIQTDRIQSNKGDTDGA